MDNGEVQIVKMTQRVDVRRVSGFILAGRCTCTSLDGMPAVCWQGCGQRPKQCRPAAWALRRANLDKYGQDGRRPSVGGLLDVRA
jgi:hypothetical protein